MVSSALAKKETKATKTTEARDENYENDRGRGETPTPTTETISHVIALESDVCPVWAITLLLSRGAQKRGMEEEKERSCACLGETVLASSNERTVWAEPNRRQYL